MNHTILIVDDSITIRSDLAEAFAANGLGSIGCATASEARTRLADASVGLIVLDVLLPDADGIEFLKEIRALPAYEAIPVLMLSSEAEVRDRIRGLATGSNDYVGKPYDRDYVVARARELLARYAPQETRRPTALVIDDSLTFRAQLTDTLNATGYDVIASATGEEGLRRAALQRPDVIVVDSVLPGIDGATVVRKIRLDAALRHTPCVLLTGSEGPGAELRALEAGADTFATKEDDLTVVLARIHALSRNSSQPNTGHHTASLLGPKKILAVDDSPTYLDALGETLLGEGYDVILAHSGEEALEMVAAQRVDCIVLDRLMPGLGGPETCRRIKASSITRDIPLIMLTASEDREAMIEGLGTGADDYILKSNDVDVIKARVRALLRRKQFETEGRRAELLELQEKKNRELASVNEMLRARHLEIEEKNRELIAATSAKSEFLSTMSHELRTPLNAVIGFGELLLNGTPGDLTDDQREQIGLIVESGRHLLELINDILDLSKIEQGKVELEFEDTNLDRLLVDSLAILRVRARERNLQLQSEFNESLGNCAVDRRRLKQILYNLLSNAVKFTPSGGNVRITARKVDRLRAENALPGYSHGMHLELPGSDFPTFVEISVFDSGIGIAAEDMLRLFTPFTRLKNATERAIEGTGLGLVAVARIAELHDGTVAVTSEPEVGSCFSVWLPWRQSTVRIE